MPQTIVEKIAQAHLAEGPQRPLRAGDFLSIRPLHVMTRPCGNCCRNCLPAEAASLHLAGALLQPMRRPKTYGTSSSRNSRSPPKILVIFKYSEDF